MYLTLLDDQSASCDMVSLFHDWFPHSIKIRILYTSFINRRIL